MATSKSKNFWKNKEEKMKRIQRILLAFMLGALSIQAVWADNNVDLLLKSAFDGDLAKIKSLIGQGTNVNAKNNKGFTALMGASVAGHLEIVEYLISKGADVNAKSNEGGLTALMVALEHIEIVEYLISQDADVNVVMDGGGTALDIAEMNKKYNVANILRKAGGKAMLSEEQRQKIKQDIQVRTARSDIASAMTSIVAKVFADEINAKAPKAPNPNKLPKNQTKADYREWGVWIMEVTALDSDKWMATKNGILHKSCSSKTPLIWINTQTGAMHFNPSKLQGGNFCKALRDSYISDKGNGDRIIPLESNGKVKF